ncbi:hypothetical protein DXT76_01065 [Halobacillus trueperi]|uniref:AbiTii domain-containing protein n=1 Tax=Halobacillus trueperi TaxID=156205 RepID=A0A3D8VTE8_9BACI|nr:hypothetical protein [Halobacillus trueperi]RDY72560.1 hypothetical protein DXT76_01065 [Halobacillus trueperi]
MAKSQILKDLVSGEEKLDSVLTRLKVILADLGNEEINKWINNEIQGYGEGDEVPPYRVLTGEPMGDFYLGNGVKGYQYSKSRVPIGKLDKEMQKDVLTLHLTDGISSLIHMQYSDSQLIKPIPAEFCGTLSQPGLQVLKLSIHYSKNQIHGVVANIKNKLTDIVMKLDKDFGNLDDLDVFSEEDPQQELEAIQQYIINVIFEDKSITIGDGNRIKDSDIGHGE